MDKVEKLKKMIKELEELEQEPDEAEVEEIPEEEDLADDSLNLEYANTGMALYRDYSKEKATSKLKRLVRA